LKNHNDLADRRSASANAKAALLSAYRAAKTAAEPSRLTRQAERVSLAEAREARRLERDRVSLEAQTRLEAEATEARAAAEAAARVETHSNRAAEDARIARAIEDEAARKAERDRRYAARKARKS